MTGGGSAGHITPILSVASELKRARPDAHIRYIGQRGDNMKSIAENHESFEKSWLIFAGKWRRYHSIGLWEHIKDIDTFLKNAIDLFKFLLGFIQSFFILLFWRPNVVFVKGGFVGLPVGLVAALLHIPIVTHDSDVMPGLTNKILSGFARKQCVGLPAEMYESYSKEKTIQTGIPVRADYVYVTEAIKQKARKQLDLPEKATVLSVIGGSLGAIRLNNALMKATEPLLVNNSELYILHISGTNQVDEVTRFYESLTKDLQERVSFWPFTNNINLITAAADLVISRAGATSIAELGIQAKPVILVPNPYLTGGHQLHNAKILENSEAVLVLSEENLNEGLQQLVESTINNKSLLEKLGINLNRLIVPDATKNIATILIEVAEK